MEATFALKLKLERKKRAFSFQILPRASEPLLPPHFPIPAGFCLRAQYPGRWGRGYLFCKVMVLLPPPTRLPHLPEGLAPGQVSIRSAPSGSILRAELAEEAVPAPPGSSCHAPQVPFPLREGHMDHSELGGVSLTWQRRRCVFSLGVVSPSVLSPPSGDFGIPDLGEVFVSITLPMPSPPSPSKHLCGA